MRVAVAMSGGVDSLRAAALLKEEGHDVFALHMRLISPQGCRNAGAEPSLREDAEENLEALASKLQIPLIFVDFQGEFDRQVITPFLETYRQGLTPNPCFVCNAKIKFGLLRREAEKLGAERLATGHYARTRFSGDPGGRRQLLRGVDGTKDQSYFLALLSPEQLAFALFPLGGEIKKHVLAWAQEAGFPPHIRGESQEICFIPSGSYQDFLQERFSLPGQCLPGPIVDMAGNQLGVHKGVFAYTVGQRRGLGIPSHAPYYVVELDASANTIRVGREKDLYRQELFVSRINWLSIAPPMEPFSASVRIRYKHRAAPAAIVPLEDNRALVRFQSPQRAVTPGQAAVFYEEDLVLGGGFIERTGRRDILQVNP